jgi:hypothetical protein
MVASNQKSIVVEKPLASVYDIFREYLSENWDLLFENKTEEQAELLYLCGKFSGVKFFAIVGDNDRKLVFIKLFSREKKKTEIIVVTGGTESWLDLDYGRLERIIKEVLKPFENPQG